MADQKFKYVPFVTGPLAARYPNLSEPDTGREYSDDKYKTEAIDAEGHEGEVEKVIAQVKKVAKDNFGADAKKALMPFKDKDGVTILKFKSPKKKPQLTDAKGVKLPADRKVGGGSIIRIAGSIAPWKKGSKFGVSLWPDAARVLKLVEGRDYNEAFGDDDGFDVKAEGDAFDQTDNSTSGDEDDDLAL